MPVVNFTLASLSETVVSFRGIPPNSKINNKTEKKKKKTNSTMKVEVTQTFDVFVEAVTKLVDYCMLPI